MPSHEWIRLLPVADCRQGCARFIAVGDLELAVFRLPDPDRFVVTPNSCPHAGGNLAAGEVADGKVTCPWHHWEFDLASGECTLSEAVSLIRYETRIDDGVLYVKSPA